MAELSQASSKATKEKQRISQMQIPRFSLPRAITLAKKLHEELAGGPAAPHQIAMAMDISPTSSNWRDLCGASIAYGLTEGGYGAKSTKLSALGRRIVAPTSNGEQSTGKVEAALNPGIISLFFRKYNGANFPSDKIAVSVLSEMGVPQKRGNEVLQVLKETGEFAGIIQTVKGGRLYVSVDAPSPGIQQEAICANGQVEEGASISSEDGKEAVSPVAEAPRPEFKSNRVFITHGKNSKVVAQLKEILTYGKFEPVVAEEHETPSVPVPDKVLEEMRSCSAGVIHVEGELTLVDEQGHKHHRINENVLIEIGAALALYGRKLILLVHSGVNLPSNLQGLYRCEYEGDSLNGEAVMKLLKACNDFR